MPLVWITVITLIFPRQSIATHLQNGLQGLKRARSSVRIERWSPEPKVRGSNPLGRIEESNGYKNKAARKPPCAAFGSARKGTILRSADCADKCLAVCFTACVQIFI